MADDNPVCLDAGTLYPHTGRRNLFASKMFVFADEAQHNHLCELISDAGGQSCMLIDADQVHELTLKFGSVCLVLPQDSCNKSEIASASAAAPVIDKVRKIANILDQRPISESEISLSIIAASVAEHTNSAPREIEQVLSSANTEVVSTVRSRRRAAPRISNFWSSMIASNADVSQPTQKTDIACNEATVPETQSETQNAEQPVSSQLMQSPALDHAHGHDSSECRISTKELPGEVDKKPNLADLKNADNDISEPGGIQQQMSRICVIPVPLIKAKQSHQSAETVGTDGLGEPELSSTVPNFKRFKKTVHLY
ncbi:hypothetical protein FB639_002725 [Coemansia asiatica]|nr:hypothetical protein FB639_002725 [Coemansia asiatica]